jgi:hypothetical protein
MGLFLTLSINDTQHNDIQPKDTQHNDIQPKDTQHNNIQPKEIQHLMVFSMKILKHNGFVFDTQHN